MWIELKTDLFNQDNRIELLNLIQILCYKHRYEIFVDLPNLKNTSIFDQIYQENIEIIEEYFNRYINNSFQIDYFVENQESSSNQIFTIDESIVFFNQPLQIILENSLNDAYFLDALLREFKNQSRKIKRHKDNHWLKYTNAGGTGSIEHVINAEIKQYKGKVKLLRFFVLVDSDLEYPQVPNPKRKNLIDLLERYNIRYHVLEKREIENYFPDESILAINKDSKFIQTYINNLTEVQKDYIDIEKGFGMNSQTLKNKKNIVYDFYKNENENNQQHNDKLENLKEGLLGEFSNFKNDFPKLFENVNQNGFLERTKHQSDIDELKNVLNKITKLL